MALIKLTPLCGDVLYINTDNISKIYQSTHPEGSVVYLRCDDISLQVTECPQDIADMVNSQQSANTGMTAPPPAITWVADSDWFENTGEQPESLEGTPMLVRFRGGLQELVNPAEVHWQVTGGQWDIVQFRYVKQEVAGEG